MLDAFLRDPHRNCERFPLRESRRQHLLDVIGQHSCDLDTTVERRGSPHSLVCTKTTASFERARARVRYAETQRYPALPAGQCGDIKLKTHLPVKRQLGWRIGVN